MGYSERPQPEWLAPAEEPKLEEQAPPAPELPPGLKKVEYRDGLPVIGEGDYWRLYNTDIRALGEKNAATFNYRGFIRSEDEQGRTAESYRDVLATNGLLKSADHPGIHVGTDGIVDYSALDRNHRMAGPEEIGEYDVYVDVPTAIQREQGVVVSYDSCFPAEEYQKQYGGDPDDLYGGREHDYIVMRLNLDPKNDPLARRKAEVLHGHIVDFIQSGSKLDGLTDSVRDLEKDLQRLKADDLEQRRLRPPPRQLAGKK